MRLLTLSIFLSLTACGKASPAPASVTCAAYAPPYMVTFPDNSSRKADVALCSDSQYKVTSLDPASPAAFEAPTVTVKLYDATTGAPYFTAFAGQ